MKRRFVVRWFAVAVLAAMMSGCVSRNARPGGDAEDRLSGGETGPRGSLGDEIAGHGPREDGPLRDVHFDYDRSDLRAEDRAILQANAQWLRDHSTANVEIEGHCDERGTGEYNMALGGKRADAVKSYLVALGIPAGRFSTISYGDELPLCREATQTCWARNRRAHSVVIQ